MPTRSCVACRTARPKRELVRVVRTPDGRIELDATGRLAGRGAYLCEDAACWRAGLDKGAVARALGGPLPAAIRGTLEAGPAAMSKTTKTTNTTNMTTTGGDKRGEE